MLLGLFVLFQLAFLFISNLLGYLKWTNSVNHDDGIHLVGRLAPRFEAEKGHGWEWMDEIQRHILRRWTQFSLEDEDWGLFSPNASKATGFPALLFVSRAGSDSDDDENQLGAVFAYDSQCGAHFLADWASRPPGEPSSATAARPQISFSPSDLLLLTAHLQDLGCVSPLDCLARQALRDRAKSTRSPRVAMMLSDNEPSDIHRFLRVTHARLRRYEGLLYFNALRKDEETKADHLERLGRLVREPVSSYRDAVLAYLKWRLKAWRLGDPERAMPAQVILCQRFYRIHDPDEPPGWDGPYLIPMARWRPIEGQADADIVFDVYDFTKRRFTPMKS